MTTTSQTGTKRIDGIQWDISELADKLKMDEKSVKNTPPDMLKRGLELLGEAKEGQEQARRAEQEAKEAKAKSKGSKSRSKVQLPEPTPRANKAGKLIQTGESWSDLIISEILSDPVASSSEAHRRAGYYEHKKEANTYNPEVNACKRTLAHLYQSGMLDAEYERKIALIMGEVR